MSPDLYKLVYRTHSADNGPVANGHVTGYLGIIAGNTIIANKTVVGKVTISHDQAILANHGFRGPWYPG